METVEVYDKAIAYIKEHGWFQGYYYKTAIPSDPSEFEYGMPVCMVGAINLIETGDPISLGAFATMDCLASVMPIDAEDGKFHTVPSFNDTPGRTIEEVIAKFEEAKARAKEGKC